jgi:hypothetical protein
MAAKLFYHRPKPRPSGTPAIRAEALSKSYGPAVALRDLTLEVPEGRFVGLLGPNGSGKTTSIHCLTTLVQPTGGSAQVAGHDVRTQGVAVRPEIGLVFQEPALDPTLSVWTSTLDNFALVMNFVIFPTFFLSGALYPASRPPRLPEREPIGAGLTQPTSGSWHTACTRSQGGCLCTRA